jgi:hypothetical protein
MKKLSWNLRLVLGLLGLVLLAIILFVVYYNVVRFNRSGALSFEAYPGAQLASYQELGQGADQSFYVLQSNDPIAVERFYVEEGFTCRTLRGKVLISDGVEQYIQSSCLLDRSHPLGFEQSIQITIQPERTEIVYEETNEGRIPVSGGALTGQVIISVYPVSYTHLTLPTKA